MMKNAWTTNRTLMIALMIAGATAMFGLAVGYGDAVPGEYRNTSPGFGWSWDFDYRQAMQEAGTFGADPWPWGAVWTPQRMVLPRGQPLLIDEIEITYRGADESGRIRLDVINRSLDAKTRYRHSIDPETAKTGFSLGNRRLALTRIDPRCIRLEPIH